MKDMWKYILIGLGTVALEWIFVAFVSAFFNGLDQTSSVVIGTGFFLAFEMVICTGVIISKMGQTKKESEDNSTK